MKRKKITRQNIEEHLIEKKIINSFSQEELSSFFFKNNYYFKASSYKKNFNKTQDHYNNELTVNSLKELAVFDTLTRFFFLRTTLDIEHYIKCFILDIISERGDIDGYEIVDEFLLFQQIENRKASSKDNARKKYIKNLYTTPYEKIKEATKNRLATSIFGISEYSLLKDYQKVQVEYLAGNEMNCLDEHLWNLHKHNYKISKERKEHIRYTKELNTENTVGNEKAKIDAQRKKRDKFKEFEKNPYSLDKIIKNKDDMSVWFFIDTITFGDFVNFIKFFSEKHIDPSKHTTEYRKIKIILNSIQSIKDFRNILAHNQVILINIKNNDKEKYNKVNSYIMKELGNKLDNGEKKYLLNNRIHDLIVILYIFFFWVDSPEAHRYKKNEFQELLQKSERLPGEITSKETYKQIKNIFNKLYQLTNNNNDI